MAEYPPPLPSPPDAAHPAAGAAASARGVPAGLQLLLFQASPLPLWVYDLETLRFLDVNEVACAMYGYTREEFLGMTILDIRPPEDREAVVASVEETPYGVFNSGIWRHRLRDGRIVFVEITSHELVFAGRRTRFVCPIDVTQRLQAQRALREREAVLEQRVHERTAQLEISMRELARATEAAERANRAKSDFLSSMSHELRTPLNAIIGFGQLLSLPEVISRPAQERAAFVDHIVDAGRHLLTLINDVLNLAQIESGKLTVELRGVAIAPLLAECRAMVAPMAGQRRIALRMHDSCALAVHADRVRLKQVLLNLLSNAVKYNRDGGTVEVRCEAIDAGDAPRAVLRVRDTGPGLDVDQVAALFQPFNRLGQEGGPFEGSGMGLVVTRRLVELMGGTVNVESRPGQGTEFRVELPGAAPVEAVVESVESPPPEGPEAGVAPIGGPAWAASPAVADPGSAASADLGRGSEAAIVLCVDDDPASLHLVQGVLDAIPGIQVVTASNGRLGVEMALAVAPSLIVMDNQMPELSGREAQALLRADPRTSSIPVIALTASAMPGDVQASLAAGSFRYLTKPFDTNELRQAVIDGLAARPAPGRR